MNMYCYFCGAQGTTYAMPLFPESSESLTFHGLSLDYECHKCEEEQGVLPVTYFGTAYSSIMTFEHCQVAVRNWTISIDIKQLTLTHWGTSTYLFKEYPKSPFSQVTIAKIPLSYLKKRLSVLEPFT